MRKQCIKNAAFISFFLISFVLLWNSTAMSEQKRPVYNVIHVSAAITPPVAEYINRNLEESVAEGVDGLIILLDTPGGLDLAMRDIAKALLNSPIPVFVYVHPSGARAASAGVIITVAAHVAAMTPGTNIGAAHPVAIGVGGGGENKTMMEKSANDAVAYVKSIAKKRGRNEEWVEKSVRKSESITAEEALKLKVIDYVAEDVERLLAQADGKKVETATGIRIIRTQNAVLIEKKMGTRQRILAAVSDPNIAYILLLIGLAGLYFELAHPGVILPGVIGGISLILAFFALQTLPVNYAGILLILFGIILFIAEIKVVSHGLLSVGGMVSLVMGSLLLFDSPDPALRVSFKVLIPAVFMVSLFFMVVVALVIKAHTKKSVTGREGMLTEMGEALTDIRETGKVLLLGEYWDAFSDQWVDKGKKVKVIHVDGLKLKVEEIQSQ
ncbi:MAG: nodulation protein NfeD [Deltaproteobacteria bacterium]|nr:nodulation protein NfeD [Deltaproteobacteria bacterium]